MPKIFAEASPIAWNWISLKGPDAQDFLHRLTSVNTRAMDVGTGSRGFFLTPMGKIRADFTLWNLAPQEYAFEFDAGAGDKWKSELLATIDQFTFSEQITILPVSGFSAVWIFLDRDETFTVDLKNGQTIAVNYEGSAIRLCNHGTIDYGRTWMTAWGEPAVMDKWLKGAEKTNFKTLEGWRIESLRPRTDMEITPDVNPLEIGLKDGIADNKGCYPGQEIIEKIVALGSPSRRLARIDGEGTPPALGEKIMNVAEVPAEVGTVSSVAQSGGKFSALSVIRKIYAKEGLDVQLGNSKAKIAKIAPYA